MCAATRRKPIIAYFLQQRCQVCKHILLDSNIGLFSCNGCQTRHPLSLRQLIIPDPLPVRTYEDRFLGPLNVNQPVVSATYTVSTGFNRFNIILFTWTFIFRCMLEPGLLDRCTSLEVLFPELFQRDCFFCQSRAWGWKTAMATPGRWTV